MRYAVPRYPPLTCIKHILFSIKVLNVKIGKAKVPERTIGEKNLQENPKVILTKKLQ